MNEPRIELSPMDVADIDAASALVGRAMNADEGRWAARTMRFHFDCRSHGLDDGRTYYLWRHDGEVKGLVGLHPPRLGARGERLAGSWFAVTPESQGQGLGRELLEAIECTAAAQGVSPTVGRDLRTPPTSTRPRRFYERHGFRRTGHIANYLPNGSSMIVYAKHLE